MDPARHYIDLARKSYNENAFTFTSFLGEAELSDFFAAENELPPCGFEMNGGFENAGRVMIRFGNPAELGYEEDWPLSFVIIESTSGKFSDDLTHRDYLGALMSLGIERSELGDIMVGDGLACLACTEKMAPVIVSDLISIKHTGVICRVSDKIPEGLEQKFSFLEIQVSSGRIDGIISKYTKLSRSKAAGLFSDRKVFVNGRTCTSQSLILKDGDRVSVRGFGKFIYNGIQRQTRKGNQVVTLSVFL